MVITPSECVCAGCSRCYHTSWWHHQRRNSVFRSTPSSRRRGHDLVEFEYSNYAYRSDDSCCPRSCGLQKEKTWQLHSGILLPFCCVCICKQLAGVWYTFLLTLTSIFSVPDVLWSVTVTVYFIKQCLLSSSSSHGVAFLSKLSADVNPAVIPGQPHQRVPVPPNSAGPTKDCRSTKTPT